MHKAALSNPKNTKEDKKRIQQQISDIEEARKMDKKYRKEIPNLEFHLDKVKIPKSIKISYIAVPSKPMPNKYVEIYKQWRLTPKFWFVEINESKLI